MIYIGIDPGKSGGLALLRDDSTIIRAIAMPDSETDILHAISDWELFGDGVYAVLERVSASPQMGVVSAFTFGRGYGGLQMALAAAQIPYDQVSPQKWQPTMGVYYKGIAKQGARDKNVAKRRAQQLWPTFKITHAIADALLLAEYCRRLEVRP